MYCWNCGKEIEEKSVFCSHCGMKQAGGYEPPEKKQKSMLLPVICAAICVGALLAMVLLLAGDGKEPEVRPQPTAAVPETTRETAETAPTQTETTAPKETKPEVNPKSAELPDLASFLDVKYTQDEWGYTHYVTCLIDREYKDEVVEEIRDLLLEPRYQLEQMDEESDAEGTHYTYEYTGKNEDIDWVYLKAGGKYHVKLTVKSGGSGKTALILYTFPEFYMKDPDSQSAYAGKLETKPADPKPKDDDNGGGGGSRYDDKCWSCGGDGRCNNCGGSGHYNQWAGDMYVNVRCTNCNGGSCRQCGGDGKK